ncbi:histidine kinase dimerization/phospho-acceptor domain-containing protein [Niallia circulans]|uniref:histidine kinase dimerization/phospho-acceptor domain-containing protein n=1 Tax=Niallia circulans TaxID=1397 RepID=UPI003526AC53
MATKSRSKGFFIVWTLLITLALSGIVSVDMWFNRYLHTDFYQTSTFQERMQYYKDLLSENELYYVPIEEAKKKITVSAKEINEYRYYYGDLNEQIQNIKSQYEEQIQTAKETGSSEAEQLYTEERDKKIADITKNFQSDEYVEDKIKKEKARQLDEYYQELQNREYEYKDWTDSFLFYFENNKTGKIVTNVDLAPGETIESKLKQKKTKFLGDIHINPKDEWEQHYISINSPWYEFGDSDDVAIEVSILNDIKKNIGSFEGVIAVPENLSAKSMLHTDMDNYKTQQKQVIYFSVISIISLVASCILLLTKRRNLTQWEFPFYKKIPIDIGIIFLLISIAVAIISVWGVNDQIELALYNEGSFWKEIILFGCLAWLFISLSFIQMSLLYKEIVKGDKSIWTKTFVGKCVKAIGKPMLLLFSSRSPLTKLILCLMIVFALGFCLMAVIVEPFFVLFFLIAVIIIGIPAIHYLVKNAKSLGQLVLYTKEIRNGQKVSDLDIKASSELSALAETINTLKNGVIYSQNAQEKSERLKTELITNVSHDLRTPLTSIINYTELLKNKNLSEEEKDGYLAIIDRKSQRLKVLIDDLFEVSKMVSGNVELKKEKIDLVQLLQQALGEYDETIKATTLDFRVTNQEPSIYAIVDGQKLWRVFDNLIGNILKYSLEHSRVYISIKLEKDQAILQFKNISKYELDDNLDELYERFKRGDTSRHTEGSGLGLAIAKSIIDLHQGMMKIETDGDLFKVTLALNLSDL